MPSLASSKMRQYFCFLERRGGQVMVVLLCKKKHPGMKFTKPSNSKFPSEISLQNAPQFDRWRSLQNSFFESLHKTYFLKIWVSYLWRIPHFWLAADVSFFLCAKKIKRIRQGCDNDSLDCKDFPKLNKRSFSQKNKRDKFIFFYFFPCRVSRSKSRSSSRRRCTPSTRCDTFHFTNFTKLNSNIFLLICRTKG